MALLALSNGLSAIVDDQDAPEALKYNWHGESRKRGGPTVYAYRHIRRPDGRKGVQRLHRFIWERMGGAQTPDVDHRNRNALDNTRNNLRAATRKQNSVNSSLRKDNTSGYRGVSFVANLWRAGIQISGKFRCIGYFKTPESAARVRDAWAKSAFGPFAALNFPDEATPA